MAREKKLKYMINNQNRIDIISLAIIEKKNDRIVGNISLNNIDIINRNYNLGLKIWEKASMRTRIEAFGLIADHAINRLNINRKKKENS